MGECYITAVMEVHKYNRVVLGFTRPCKLAWNWLLHWIHMNQDAEVLHLEEVHRSISTFHNEVFHASFTSFMDDSSSVRILQLFQDYLVSSRAVMVTHWQLIST